MMRAIGIGMNTTDLGKVSIMGAFEDKIAAEVEAWARRSGHTCNRGLWGLRAIDAAMDILSRTDRLQVELQTLAIVARIGDDAATREVRADIAELSAFIRLATDYVNHHAPHAMWHAGNRRFSADNDVRRASVA